MLILTLVNILIQLNPMLLFPQTSILLINLENVSTQSEINNHAVPVGLSVHQKLSLIDYALPQMVHSTWFSHHKIQSHVTRTKVVVVVGHFQVFGITQPPLVLFLILACHTHLVLVKFKHAQVNALMAQPSRDISAKMTQQLLQELLTQSRLNFLTMDLWTLTSQSMRTL